MRRARSQRVLSTLEDVSALNVLAIKGINDSVYWSHIPLVQGGPTPRCKTSVLEVSVIAVSPELSIDLKREHGSHRHVGFVVLTYYMADAQDILPESPGRA